MEEMTPFGASLPDPRPPDNNTRSKNKRCGERRVPWWWWWHFFSGWSKNDWNYIYVSQRKAIIYIYVLWSLQDETVCFYCVRGFQSYGNYRFVCVCCVGRSGTPKVTRKFWATFSIVAPWINKDTSWPPYGPGRYSRHAHVYLPCHSQQYTHVLLSNHYRSRFLSESEGRNTFPTEPHISHPNVWDVHLSHPRSMTKMWTIWAEC